MMGELPKGWALAPLGDVVDILDRLRVPVNRRERAKRQGPFPYYGATGQVGWIDDYLFDEDLVLLGEDGAPFFDLLKAVAYRIKGKTWVNNHAHVLRARGCLTNGLLLHQLNQIQYKPFVSGTTRAKLPQGPMRQIPMSIPPLPEQRRIVAAIEQHFSRLDAAVVTLERVKAKLGQTRASVLKAAVEGRLVPTEAAQAGAEGRDYEHASVLLERILAERRERWEQAAWEKEVDKAKQKAAKAHRKAKGRPLQRGEKLDPAEWEDLSEDEYRRYLPKGEKWKAKYKKPVEPDLEGLPALPEGWVWATVERVCQEVTDGDHQPPPVSETGVPFLVIGDVRDGSLRFAGARRVPAAYYDGLAWKRRPDSHDLLYTVVGSFGIPVVIPTDKPFCVQRHIAILKAPLAGVKAFLHRALSSRFVFSQASEKATGTAQKTLGLQRLREIVVPLPPLAEQHRIVAEVDRQLSVLDEVGRLVDANLARCARLRQAILKRAFEGRLVPQDPNDEPASVLLERIKERDS